MASRKLIRDLLLPRKHLFLQLKHQQLSNSRLWKFSTIEHLGDRRFSVFSEFSKTIKGEAERNPEFKRSVKELKEKAEELKEAKEQLKVRTKQTTEKLYKRVDDVWTEAGATVKKVSADVKGKILSAKEEAKETFGAGKQGSDTKHESQAADGEQTRQQPKDSAETLFGHIKSIISSPKVSLALQKFKEAKFMDLAKKGYEVVRDELSNKPSTRKNLEFVPSPSPTGEISTRTDIVIVPQYQSRWRKAYEAAKHKVRGTTAFKRINKFGEPVMTKGQAIVEDVREIWETSDNAFIHKLQDLNDSITQETDAAASLKEILRRDPSFALPDLVAEIQEVVKPILIAYMEGDEKFLKKYCTREVINRRRAERHAFQSHGIIYDNKLLHVADVDVRETKLIGDSPMIIVAIPTQQIHCVRDEHGKVTEGGKDTIHSVIYMWAMEQIRPEEVGEGAIYPIWKIREVEQSGIQTLI